MDPHSQFSPHDATDTTDQRAAGCSDEFQGLSAPRRCSDGTSRAYPVSSMAFQIWKKRSRSPGWPAISRKNNDVLVTKNKQYCFMDTPQQRAQSLFICVSELAAFYGTSFEEELRRELAREALCAQISNWETVGLISWSEFCQLESSVMTASF